MHTMESKEDWRDVLPLAALMRARNALQLILGSAAMYLLLLWVTWRWPGWMTSIGIPVYPALLGEKAGGISAYPLYEMMKLVAAALLGTILTQVHKYYQRERLLSRSLEQAQIMLCVSGAMMMIIIGDSMARAFGIAGAAAIIRFRTPVEDPKDTTMLFLVLGVGMACGLGAFSIAGLAAFFLCLLLSIMDRIGEHKPRTMLLELVASGPDFPTAHVQNIFAAYGSVYEVREIAHGEEATVKYQVVLEPNTPLDCMSDQLLSGGESGLKSVAWQNLKKSN
jgi:hypothetical protein